MSGLLNAVGISDFFSWEEAYGGNPLEHLKEKILHAVLPEQVDFFGWSGLQVSPAIYSSFAVTLVIIIACVLIRIFLIPRLKDVPGRLQLVLESLVGYFHSSSAETVHKRADFMGPYVFTTAIFISLGTLIELLGFRPTYSSINACIATGMMTFFVVFYFGFEEHKWKRIKHYLNPMNIMTDVAVPLSLSLRLFGAIISGFVIAELLYSLLALTFIIPIIAALITTIFHAVLQAYLFATLSNMYVSEAIE
ncbi:MAG: F0F1 ATP synthase subunit A [Christensenellaceae bacterium]|nr:F0F1 ATP synthase subunit A [Christensenellaceae bacterium]